MVKNLVIAGMLLLAAACTPEGNEVMLEVSIQPKWNGQDLTYQMMSVVDGKCNNIFRCVRFEGREFVRQMS